MQTVIVKIESNSTKNKHACCFKIIAYLNMYEKYVVYITAHQNLIFNTNFDLTNFTIK